MLILLLTTIMHLSADTLVVSRSEIERAVMEYVERHVSSPNKEVSVEFRSVPENVPVSSSGYRVRVAVELPTRTKGNLSLPVEIVRGERVERRVIVSIKVRLFGLAAVSARHIDRHTQLGSDDVRWQRLELTSLPSDVVTDAAKLAHVRTKRILSEGTLLTENMVEPLPQVEQGAIVTVQARANNVIVSSKAVAKEDGWTGRFVTVQKVGSHQRLRAKVIKERTVELAID